MATTAICNRKTTATSSPRPHTPQHHGIGATAWHQEQPSPSPARFISIADFSPTRIQTRKPAWSTVTNPLRGNLVPADHSAAPRGSTFTSQRIYHSSQLSHPRFHVPVLLVSHPMTDTPSHVFDQTGHGGRQTRIGRRVYCRCAQMRMPQTVLGGEQASWKSCSQRDHLPSLVAVSTARNRKATARRKMPRP